MRYLFSLLLSLLLLSTPLLANSNSVEESSESGEPLTISLITCDVGDELYAAYGHSALRLKYRDSGEDLIFNFGLFDFATPNFYWKFIRGKLKYLLGIQYPDHFIYQYMVEGRGVEEQILNLSKEQIDSIEEQLKVRYRPENREYYYSFLYKNCTSELRDLIATIMDGEELRPLYETNSSLTFREHLNGYTSGWTRFGINLILGSTIDREITLFESMFLPQNLFDELREVTNGGEPIVREEATLYLHRDESGKGDSGSFWATIFSPLSISIIFSLLLLLSLVLHHFKKRRSLLWLSNGLISIAALGGLFLLFVTIITEHTELYYNYNMLWCNPLFTALIIASIKGWKKMERTFLALSTVSLALLFAIWLLKVQFFELPFAIISLTLLIIFIYRLLSVRD